MKQIKQRVKDKSLYDTIKQKLVSYEGRNLPGISAQANLDCFTWQIVDSIKRIKYVEVIRDREVSETCSDPQSTAFDPIKAASYYIKKGNIDEAFWLVFLATHFGKNKKSKWGLVKAVYSGLGDEILWDWNTVSQDPEGFREWLRINNADVKARGKVGNHRKYTSLSAINNNGTGAAVVSYVDWICQQENHEAFFNNILINETNPKVGFKKIYKSMDYVRSFGRMGKFDYLTMVGKLGLLNIQPDSVYMQGATGPFEGATKLFGGNPSRRELNRWLEDLENHLNLNFGMQVLEDAICNWNKNPGRYIYFGG
ncbi:alpha-glutamyl/putrescinyl thymine pyrophosphorylase clade 3 protein [Flavobacterium litorale]|uniref:Alpha-glutamyl/putrescinyl thymine pyrophosphorylase clade 3 domain-containing protein n=1 Tax=Flavobacterium litorale TaxID=2856519 RepID=A0ABX8V4N4_9FLAO|nr:hypothetical protein [Flavobacterium litorale]QYJ67722.1 hypothetical protein K1I41_09225 [Flavobacterium litorale]